MSQIHFITPSAVGTRSPEIAATAHSIAQGEFRGLARWLTTGHPSRHPMRDCFQIAASGIVAHGEDPRDGDDGLGALLAAIGDEVMGRAAAARQGVIADFAARAAHARKHLSSHLLAATLSAIREQRKAALALIKANAAQELAGRRRAAILAKAPRRVSRRRRSGKDRPGLRPA